MCLPSAKLLCGELSVEVVGNLLWERYLKVGNVMAAFSALGGDFLFIAFIVLHIWYGRTCDPASPCLSPMFIPVLVISSFICC